MTDAIHTDLLTEIEAYCEAHDITFSRFGLLMMNDPALVFDLRKGRELRRTTERSLRQKMQAPPERLAS